MTGTTISGTYMNGVTLSNAATQNPATIATATTVAAAGTPGEYTALYAEAGTAWTITNYGLIEATTGPGTGISLASDSLVLNTSSGIIDGASYGIELTAGGTAVNQGTILAGSNGIDASGGSATVVNAGSIIGSGTGNGIGLLAGGSVTNQGGGLISGNYGIVGGALAAVTVVNYGSIAGTGTVTAGTGTVTAGVDLLGGGSVTNQAGGTISGYTGIYGGPLAAVTVLNYGNISGSAASNFATGINLQAGGSVYNQSGGTISGYEGILGGYSGALAVVNDGSIAGDSGSRASDAVILNAGGGVTNQAGGTITGYNGVFGGTIAVTVVNYGDIAASGNAGVYVASAGSGITNQAGGTISGFFGVLDSNGALTVVNYGSITGYIEGVGLFGGGTVTNQSGGTITGADGIIGILPVTVMNAGSIAATGTYGSGVDLSEASSVTNQANGAISGYYGIVAAIGPLTLVNAGSIGGIANYGNSGHAAGVLAAAGGTITNQVGGTIAGYHAIAAEGVLTVINAGSITGYGGGIGLFAGGYVTNQSGGTITGTVAAYGYRFGAAVTVVNAGNILGASTGTNAAGVALLGGGTVINQAGGTITGYDGIYGTAIALTVINIGDISGYNHIGVALYAGGYITNQSDGTISSGHRAAYADAALTVVNDGSIIASGSGGEGIDLNAGGSVTNQSGGTISGKFEAIAAFNTAIAVYNYGVILGYGLGGKGIALSTGGGITNQAGGTISGQSYGISGSGGPVTVSNAGLIAAYGAKGKAVHLAEGGTVINQAGGTIGGHLGINSLLAGMTVVNAGTIIGTGGTAIQFAAGYTNLLTIDPGAVFTGTADGGNTVGATAVSTLELAPGTSIGTLSGLGTQFIDFTQTTIDTGAYWVLNGSNSLAAGTTLTNAGTLAVTDATFFDAGQVINDGTIVTDPSNVTFGSLAGTGDVAIDSGGALNVIGTVTSGETISFSGNNDLLGASPAAFAGQVNGFTFGDAIDLAGVTDGLSPQVVNGNTLEIQRSNNPAVFLTLDPSVDYTGNTFAISPTGAVTETPCFVTGTLIRTDRGEVAVESLTVGDRVVTLSGSLRPIRWIGHRDLDLTRHPEPRRVQPVAILAHAFGDSRPSRDLFLSPEHGVLVQDGLVPVRLLVNGASIQREQGRRRVTYYHVELETHDILLAEDLAVESYLETGNRGMFENAGKPLLLHPDPANGQARRTVESCMPFVDDPARVEPMWRALAERAAQRGWAPPPMPETTGDPALCLIVDGRPIAPIGVIQGKHVFAVPAGAARARLRSRAAIPSDTAPWVADDRRLGVLLRGLTVRSGAGVMPIPLDHPGLRAGWWQPEWHGSAILRRWTDGDALLPVSEWTTGVCLLEVEVAATLAYPLPLPPSSPLPLPASSPPAIRHSA
jgi:Hint domain